VTLASNGVLYLDEIARDPALDARSAARPARGRRGHDLANERDVHVPGAVRAGRVDDAAVERYRAKLFGPLLDRIDLHVRVARVPFDELTAAAPGEPSQTIRARVVSARERRRARGVANARLRGAALARHADSTNPQPHSSNRRPPGAGSARAATIASGASPATIADLAGDAAIARKHVAEALLYRRA
jgi:magnesium chelatase family protein